MRVLKLSNRLFLSFIEIGPGWRQGRLLLGTIYSIRTDFAQQQVSIRRRRKGGW
jgi:hypothetical protein